MENGQLTKMIFVTCGQITLKTQVNLQLALALIINFPTELPLVSGIFLHLVKKNCNGATSVPGSFQRMLEVKVRCLWCSYWLWAYSLWRSHDKSSVCKTLKICLVLPLFKGKGAKANNKDNYRGITLFPTLYKSLWNDYS